MADNLYLWEVNIGGDHIWCADCGIPRWYGVGEESPDEIMRMMRSGGPCKICGSVRYRYGANGKLTFEVGLGQADPEIVQKVQNAIREAQKIAKEVESDVRSMRYHARQQIRALFEGTGFTP